MPLTRIKVALFDLGGVLLQLRDTAETFGLNLPENLFLERWLLSPSVRRFESGAIDADTFARSMVDELEIRMEWREFQRRFDSWPERIYPEAIALLDSIPAGIQRALLSNTNAAHWGRSDISAALAGRLDRTFLSFRTGLVKPDREAFEQVPAAYGLAPDEFLFFDDNPLNVSAAAAIGMQAVLCKGPADAKRVLDRL